MNDSAKTTAPNGERGTILFPGFAAGVLGGLAMAVWMMASAIIEGMEPFAPLRPMGDTFAGPEGRGDGAAVLLLGLALHVVFSGGVGIIFTTLLPKDLAPGFASVVSVGFAFAAMAIMTSSVLPACNPSLRAEMPELGGSWVLAHAVYGATAGFFAQKLRLRRPPAPVHMETTHERTSA